MADSSVSGSYEVCAASPRQVRRTRLRRSARRTPARRTQAIRQTSEYLVSKGPNELHGAEQRTVSSALKKAETAKPKPALQAQCKCGLL